MEKKDQWSFYGHLTAYWASIYGHRGGVFQNLTIKEVEDARKTVTEGNFVINVSGSLSYSLSLSNRFSLFLQISANKTVGEHRHLFESAVEGEDVAPVPGTPKHPASGWPASPPPPAC